MKKLFRSISTLILLLAFAPTSINAYQQIEISDAVKRSIIERIDNGDNQGIVVGIINKSGTDFYSYGYANEDKSRKVDKHSIFEIGSISKVFTSIILSDMILNDEIQIEDPIEKFLPEKITIPERDGKRITLWNLATHTSGLPRMPNNFHPKDPMNPYADYTVDNMYDCISAYKLRRDIGRKYEYSNLGMGLLGHILSLKAEKEYEELVRERISSKLNMNDTMIKLNTNAKNKLAEGHSRGKKVSNWDIPTLEGAGAIRSSAVDMIKFVGANLGIDKTELDKTLNFSHKEQFDISRNMKIALAWHINIDGQKEIIWHNGGTGGYRSFCGFSKNENIGIVVLTNSNMSCDDIGFHILDSSNELKKTKRE